MGLLGGAFLLVLSGVLTWQERGRGTVGSRTASNPLNPHPQSPRDFMISELPSAQEAGTVACGPFLSPSQAAQIARTHQAQQAANLAAKSHHQALQTLLPAVPTPEGGIFLLPASSGPWPPVPLPWPETPLALEDPSATAGPLLETPIPAEARTPPSDSSPAEEAPAATPAPPGSTSALPVPPGLQALRLTLPDHLFAHPQAATEAAQLIARQLVEQGFHPTLVIQGSPEVPTPDLPPTLVSGLENSPSAPFSKGGVRPDPGSAASPLPPETGTVPLRGPGSKNPVPTSEPPPSD